MEKVDKLDIDMIAPSHGPVYDDPSLITDAYKEWISDDVKKTVVFPFLSMHHSTKKMADHFIDELMERDITVKPFNITSADLGEMAMAMVDAATIVIGSPTVLVYAHPTAAYAALVASALKPKAKFVSIIGSYGWGSKMVEQLSDIVGRLQAEVLEPVISKGVPEEEDFTALTQLAEKILAKHTEIGIV
jgi:flavorubredoxin